MDKNSKEEWLKRHQPLLFYIYYIVLSIINIMVRPYFSNIEAVLGDFGNITPVLLTVFAVYGLKWTLIFSVLGIVLTALRKYFSEVNKIYAITTGFVLSISIVILLIF